MNKKIFAVLAMFAAVSVFSVFADDNSANVSYTDLVNQGLDEQSQFASETAEGAKIEAETSSKDAASASAVKYIAAALAVGLACIGGSMAVGKIGAAAMGAMSENAELSGKALPFVGLAEGICLWGFLVALFIIIM